MLRSRRGSYILEAAIVMPVIMLSVITAVLIIMFFYRQMSEQCMMHRTLIDEASFALRGEGFSDDPQMWDGSIYTEGSVFTKDINAEKRLDMGEYGILERSGEFLLEDRYIVVDGTGLVRYCSIMKER